MAKRHYISTNNGNKGLMREAMGEPCGLPMGAHVKDVGNGDYFSMNAYRVGDLFEQVDRNMREDSANMKSQTKPTNW